MDSLSTWTQDATMVILLYLLWLHHEEEEKRREKAQARQKRLLKRQHERTYAVLSSQAASLPSSSTLSDVQNAMMKSLVEYIRSQQNPILESLQQCGTNFTTHQDDTYDELIDLAKNNINVFPLSDVKACWFQLYANAGIMKAAQLLEQVDTAQSPDDLRNDGVLSQTVSALDNALIIAGGGNDQTKEVIHEVLRRLDRILYPRSASDSDENADDEEFQPQPTKRRRLHNDSTMKTSSKSSQRLPTNLAFVPKIAHPVPRFHSPTLAGFESSIRKSNTPIILNDTLTHWPALQKWQHASYWLRRTLAGNRLVPIEIGQSYTDDGWRQEIMTFRRFLRDFILRGDDAEEIGYLAQHDLFSQIPELRADIEVPDFCFADVPTSSSSTTGGLKRKAKEMSLPSTTEDPRKPAEKARVNRNTASTQPRVDREDNSSGKTEHKSASTHPRHDDQTPTNQLTPPQQQPKTSTSAAAPRTSDSSASSPSPPPPPTIHQNIWFGTRTVTPLHHDPYSNILTQIHGTKYIRLYSPEYTANLYPRSATEVAPHISSDSHNQPSSDADGEKPCPTIDMSNTSNISLWEIEQSPHEDWDEMYPGFSQAPYVECLLREGEALYIPKGWWHYVRGVSAVGIGVSFWW